MDSSEIAVEKASCVKLSCRWLPHILRPEACREPLILAAAGGVLSVSGTPDPVGKVSEGRSFLHRPLGPLRGTGFHVRLALGA